MHWARAGHACSVQEIMCAWAAGALTRGRWASGSAQRWDTCAQGREEADVSARLRLHCGDADAERQRAGFKAPVSARTDEQAAGMLGSAQSGQRAAGSARVRRQQTCLGGSEGPLASVIYAGREPSAPPVIPGHPRPKFC